MFSLIVKAFVSLLAFDSLAMGNHQKENFKVHDPPCFFNPLCTCSKSYPDLGRVTCKNIPMLTVPNQINSSKVFMLHLENNGLRYLEPYFFRQTGLFRIEITENFLTEIREETFTGLERTLWELKLKQNKFRRVPNQSFRHLQKLKMLDLSDNLITSIGADDWLGLENSLKTLILSGNKLSTLRPRVFSILQQLESLDLSGNALFEFDAMAFKDGPSQLIELLLADNLLSSIPFRELSELRELRHLDLSSNQITEIKDFHSDRSKGKQGNLVLDTLRLDYNQIQYLRAESFKSFPTLNRTYLNGNPITAIEKDAFRRSKIRELYLKDCDISELTVESFSGLPKLLEVLDLEGNNLTTLPLHFIKEFDSLKSLNLKDNFLKEIDSDKMFDGEQPSLKEIDLSGEGNSAVQFQNLDKLHNLRSLSISKLSQSSLSAKDLPEFLIELEEIKISYSNIKILKSHAFKNVRGLRKLDLSENSISTIEDKAFSEVGHSLIQLSLANGLSSGLSQLPHYVFEDLTSMELLDLSNNRIKTLPKKLFYSMNRLRTVLIQDNSIEFIPKGTFQGDIHSELNTIQFSFNQLSSIESQSFVGLSKLEYLWLNDNKITKIEKRAFENLDRLKCLYLRGNKINLLKEESFQDLPQLEHLDLAYNQLKTFNYGSLEQVGTLSSFTLNVSHNNIGQLTNNLTQIDFDALSVNVKALDLSFNNISNIGRGFFKPIESSLTHLYLSHNKLPNVTRTVFGSMIHLQWLDISSNFISNLDYDSFANTKNIQVLYLSNNYLEEIPRNFFKGFHRLRILNLERNELRTLPDDLFSDAMIERLDISNNQLTRVPIGCFDMDSASSLLELDMSRNAIVALPSAEAFASFKNLYWLNLSKNRIIRVEDGTFSFLRRLHVLDLSHNADLNLDSKGQTFYGLDALEDLVLKNLSLNGIPALPLRSLISLDVSDNNIFTVPFEFSHNMSQLERIELSGNEMVTIPPAINALTKLQYLGVSRNPLESINFQQSFSLRELDLRNISLSLMEKGALGKMSLLESLRLTINQNVGGLNPPQILKHNYALNHLYIEVLGNEGSSSLGDEMSEFFPPKLQNLTLYGRGLKAIPRNLLKGVRSPRFHLVIFNTSLQEIGGDVFDNARKIRNLTLDLRSNKLKTVFNPNTGDAPNSPKKMFLLDLKISDNDWTCDCSIGWIEGWERKKRQYLCEGDPEECFLASDDFRAAVCNNRKPIIEVFKTELECGWNSGRSLRASVFVLLLSMISLRVINVLGKK